MINRVFEMLKLTDFDERRAALSRWIKKQVIKVEVSALIAGP